MIQFLAWSLRTSVRKRMPGVLRRKSARRRPQLRATTRWLCADRDKSTRRISGHALI